MNQIALPLFDANPLPRSAAWADAPAGTDTTGFEIGWDYAHHRLTPPADHLHGLHPVRQGWEAGRAVFGARTLRPGRAVQQWLGLRLQAWHEDIPFEEVLLTPRFLAQIEVAVCPVTRAVVSADPDSLDAAVPMRLNLDAGMAAGNLAMVSRRVLQARGHADAGVAQAIARRLADGDVQGGGGLDAECWARLASLLRLAEPLPHAQVACLPLRVMPPNRLRLLNPVQALQALLTQLLMDGSAYARRMLAIGATMPDGETRRCYLLFMNALLARRVGAGWGLERQKVRHALEDAWCQPVVQRRWEHLALRLTRAQCARIVRLAAQRGQGGGWRWLDDDEALQGWAMPPRSPSGAAGAARDSRERTPAEQAGDEGSQARALVHRRWLAAQRTGARPAQRPSREQAWAA